MVKLGTRVVCNARDRFNRVADIVTSALNAQPARKIPCVLRLVDIFYMFKNNRRKDEKYRTALAFKATHYKINKYIHVLSINNVMYDTVIIIHSLI